MKTITVDKVINWGPCYRDPWVHAAFGDRKTVSAKTIAAGKAHNGTLRHDDRVWLLAHMVPEEKARPLAIWLARRAINRKKVLSDSAKKDLRAALRVGEKHARGEATDTELFSASRTASLVTVRHDRHRPFHTAQMACTALRPGPAWKALWVTCSASVNASLKESYMTNNAFRTAKEREEAFVLKKLLEAIYEDKK
jgi:hypothetical protein